MTHYVYILTEGTIPRYVGYTARLKQRTNCHANDHPAWRLVIVGTYATRQMALAWELCWIKHLRDSGYGLANVLDGGSASPTGRPPSELTRARISLAMKGKRNGLGYRASPEEKERRARFHRGRVRTAETRRNIASGLVGNKNWLGKTHSLAARAKVSEAMKGNKHSLGHTRTTETRSKISAAVKSQWSRPGHRARVAASVKASWLARKQRSLAVER